MADQKHRWTLKRALDWASQIDSYASFIPSVFLLSGAFFAWLDNWALVAIAGSGLLLAILAKAVVVVLGERGALVTAAIVLLVTGASGWYRWNNFELTPATPQVLRDGYTKADGHARITGVHLQIGVENRNEFPVYYRIIRRFGSVGDKTTSLVSKEDLDIPPQRLEANQSVMCTSDKIEQELENGKHHFGEFECRVLYGRSPDSLNKEFVYSQSLRWFLCPVNGLICGGVFTFGRTDMGVDSQQ